MRPNQMFLAYMQNVLSLPITHSDAVEMILFRKEKESGQS